MNNEFKRRSIDSCIKLSNMFSILQDMEVSSEMVQDGDVFLDHMFLIGKKNIFSSKRKVKEQKKEVIKAKKSRQTDSLKIFLVNNRYSLLTDNPEFEIEKLIQRNLILKTSKKTLKKCRFCNFKKRSCLLDPDQCKALHSQCFKCNKKGHFPASIKCQIHKRIKRKSLQKQVIIYYYDIKNK